MLDNEDRFILFLVLTFIFSTLATFGVVHHAPVIWVPFTFSSVCTGLLTLVAGFLTACDWVTEWMAKLEKLG